MYNIKRCDPLSKVTETLGGSWGCDGKGGWAGWNWVEGAKSELGGPHALHSPSFQIYGRPSASPWSVSWAAVRAAAEQRLF